jgi:hypothetical protein
MTWFMYAAMCAVATPETATLVCFPSSSGDNTRVKTSDSLMKNARMPIKKKKIPMTPTTVAHVGVYLRVTITTMLGGQKARNSGLSSDLCPCDLRGLNALRVIIEPCGLTFHSETVWAYDKLNHSVACYISFRTKLHIRAKYKVLLNPQFVAKAPFIVLCLARPSNKSREVAEANRFPRFSPRGGVLRLRLPKGLIPLPREIEAFRVQKMEQSTEKTFNESPRRRRNIVG